MGKDERKRELPRFDGRLRDAVTDDMAAYVGEVMSSVVFRGGRKGVHGVRTAQELSSFGWTEVRYPYRRETDDRLDFRRAFGIERRMTPCASETVSRLAVQLGSFKEARDVPSFAKSRYGSLEALNDAWAVPHRSFFDISFRTEYGVLANPPATNFTAWLDRKLAYRPNDSVKFDDWLALKKHYVTQAIADGDHVSRTLPADLAGNREEIRNALAIQFVDHGTRDFYADAFANYRTVGDYLFLRGRAFFNTFFLVVLSVLASLTVNPLAAYALSRFRLKGTEKILLFLLATMAFPAAVTAIPGVLLMRDLGLLNTFAGQPWCVMAGFVLVLIPTAAVFLLFQKVILHGIVLPSMK